MPPGDRSRLLARLRGYDAERLVAAARDRAERHELRVLPAYRQRLLAAEWRRLRNAADDGYATWRLLRG